jgi:hypothetical protein
MNFIQPPQQEPTMQSFTTTEQARNWFFDDTAELDFADNFRFAFADDAAGVATYEEAVNCGCCGYVDTKVLVAGRTYWMGCNYGH